MSSLQANKAAARRFLVDIWSQGNPQAAQEILSPSFVFLLGVDPYRVEGIEPFMRIVDRNRGAFAGLTYTPDDENVVAEANRVIYPWVMHAHHSGPWAGYSPSDKDVSIKGMSLFHFDEAGKITQCQVQNEALSLVRQIGGIPPIGKGVEYKVTEQSKAIVMHYVDELLVKGNFAIAKDLVGPNFKIDRSALPEGIAGPDALKRQMDMLKEAFPDLDLQIADTFAEGDKVAVRFRAPGTHQNDFMGIAPTGRSVVWKGIVIYRVEDGKVAEAWADWDDFGLIQSLR